MESITPHDLLYVKLEDLIHLTDIPDWFDEKNDWDWVVVRRASLSDETIPVGIRGNERNKRHGCFVKESAINQVVTPTQLISDEFLEGISTNRQQSFKIFQSFNLLKELLKDYVWGIGGSLAYELVSKELTVKESSDLDVLVYAKSELDKQQIDYLYDVCQQLDTRVDIQIMTPFGGCSLLELHKGGKKVLLKTLNGPMLVENPWVETTPSIKTF